MAHTELIGMLHKTASFKPFDRERIALTENGGGVFVKGLFEELARAYDEEKLFSEL